MLERLDLEFKFVMERELRRLLHGDDGEGGLYRGLLSCEDWDSVNRTKGSIIAYENVLKTMQEVAKRMNENEEPVRHSNYARSGFPR
jgi:hypothetical protein